MIGSSPSPPSDGELLAAVARSSDGVAVSDLEAAFGGRIGRRALQRRLATLVESARLDRLGSRRWTRYAVPVEADRTATSGDSDVERSLSTRSLAVLRQLERPFSERPVARYRSDYLSGYSPGDSAWLSEAERMHLRRLGTVVDTFQPAGTYARRIADRLLIDLSWNSSRLEGNTYSLLDTRRLIALGVEAEGRDPRETRMIRNHRDAIEFLIENVAETGFDRLTILNVHALLANELLPDPSSPGRLRRMAVGIGGSTYRPSDSPQVVEADFDALLTRLGAIDDPFEQSLLALAQLPYLQPFDDVNKRVSRLAANLPMIRENLVPVSFVGVPRGLYTRALLAVYELEDHRPLKELYIGAYERSVEQYAEVRQTLGEPDPFRLRYIDRVVALIGEAVRDGVTLREAVLRSERWAREHAAEPDRERFREMVETELLGLNEGNFARFGLRPSEFRRWQAGKDIDANTPSRLADPGKTR